MDNFSEYDIISGQSPQELKMKVEAKLNHGWKLIGGLVYIIHEGQATLLQSMAR